MAPYTDIATRALVVTLKSPSGWKTTAEVVEITGISTRQVNRIYARAIERGFDPNHRPLTIRDEFLRDASRPGRPVKQTDEIDKGIVAKVRQDRFGREKTYADIAGELSAEWHRDLGRQCVADPPESWIPQDQADEEAWVDEEDEK